MVDRVPIDEAGADMAVQQLEPPTRTSSNLDLDRPGRFVARYGPTGSVMAVEPGSVEHFLTERYCLYAVDDNGQPLRGHIQHAPWPLQPGFCDIEDDTVVPVPLARTGQPLVHFARRIDVVGWPLQPAR